MLWWTPLTWYLVYPGATTITRIHAGATSRPYRTLRALGTRQWLLYRNYSVKSTLVVIECYISTTDIQIMPTSNALQVGQGAMAGGSATTPHKGHSTKRVRARVASIIGLVIGVLLIPFLDHRSAQPIVLTYSLDYLAFLALLMVGAIASAQALAFLVRRAPLKRQVPFALLILTGLVGSAAAAEFYLGYAGRDAFHWYRSWGHVRSPLTGFVVKPEHRWQMRHDAGRTTVTYTTDPLGLRTHLRPRAERPDEIVIAAIGGSAVFGYGLNDNETWPHLLEGELRDRFGAHITVLNAGCNGHNTLQQLIRYQTTVRKLEPHFLIHYGAINDIRPDHEISQLIPFPDQLLEARTSRDYLGTLNYGQGFYLEHSLLINLLMRSAGTILPDYDHRGNEPIVGPQHKPSVPFDKTADLFVENLNSLRALATSHDTQFVPITFLANLEQLESPFDVGVGTYVQRLRNHCRQHSVSLIDLWPDYLREEKPAGLFAPDNYHLSKRGAVYLADRVAEALAPRIEAWIVSANAKSGHLASKR